MCLSRSFIVSRHCQTNRVFFTRPVPEHHLRIKSYILYHLSSLYVAFRVSILRINNHIKLESSLQLWQKTLFVDLFSIR